MKRSNSIMLSLVFLCVNIFIACNKKEIQPADNTPPNPVTVIFSNKENLRQYPWQKSAGGFEILYATNKITQDQINRGINVSVAMIGADDSPWIHLPSSYFDAFVRDTVLLSFQVTPGQLRISAQTNFDLSNY